MSTVPEQNPYEVLQVLRDATLDEIEDAYDALYDLHEPAARAGDAREIAYLNSLNEAREILIDPQRRARLDQRLRESPRKPPRPDPTRTRPTGGTGAKAQAMTQTRPASSSRPAGGTATAPMPEKVRRRSAPRPRYVAPPANNRRTTILIASVVMLVLVFGLALFLLLRGRQDGLAVTPDPTRGEVIATVNGVPIYSDDWQERLDRDRNSALSDPLFAPFVNNFQGVTGTRMLDILSYDAMDKLINFEVILQQARKEGLYPTPAQEKGLIDEAKQKDLTADKSFEQFLKERNISEARYNRTVIQNVVYTVMADRHLPPTGTSQARTEGFIKWICETRKSYDVRILKHFIVAENVPCTSGLPSDLPLPGVEQEEVPDELATAVVPPNPNATPAP
ncbi:MAG TPA: SurA N-terminal domain-containing protein [Chloroflexia bacterium]